MTVPLMMRVDFAVAGMDDVGADRHLGGDLFKKSSAWPSHPWLSWTSNGARTL